MSPAEAAEKAAELITIESGEVIGTPQMISEVSVYGVGSSAYSKGYVSSTTTDWTSFNVKSETREQFCKFPASLGLRPGHNVKLAKLNGQLVGVGIDEMGDTWSVNNFSSLLHKNFLFALPNSISFGVPLVSLVLIYFLLSIVAPDEKIFGTVLFGLIFIFCWAVFTSMLDKARQRKINQELGDIVRSRVSKGG